ncbi:hypothetical protein KXD93_27715 [Mucilaginibacter sp. BJC16-A38]|uniref:hypothetical protein n=1 Tax=Mucilaginibacter phenanthrenivorans TaxID=1234842 RepID=UPI002157C571|nr:hypothetical protein [Mucilaginibacter phenanthrenivorans]MCR8561473.1 hypothetical protein [Mucilaginibacter phenanthrenivorans]
MEKRPTPNVLTGREGEPFDLELSASWTKNYRDRHPGETISHFFGREIIEKILAQEGCLGIRMYYSNSKSINGWQRAMVAVSNFILKVLGNIEDEQHIIITGSISDGNDMLRTTAKPLSSVGEPLARTELAKVMADPPPPQPLDIVGQQAMPCPGSPGCPKNVLTTSVS